MKKILYLLIGLALGFALGSPAAQAIEGILAQRCTSPILLNGAPIEIEAYNINGHNYFKLRDIGKAVGFNVYWNAEDGTVQIETNRPYTGEAPAKVETDKPVSQPEVTASAADVDAMKQDIVDRTNALRKENGIAALTANDKLMQAAQVRADEMAETPSTPIPAQTGGNIPRSRTANMSGRTSTKSHCYIWNSKRESLWEPLCTHGQSPQGTWRI